MLKWSLCVMALVGLATTAPVQQENLKVHSGVKSEDGTPLLRAKRSGEVIMFGNQQNVNSADVVKKKSLLLDEDDSGQDEDQANLIDRNAKMETMSDRAEDLAGNPDIKDTDDLIADSGDLNVAELLAEEAVKEQEEEQQVAQEEAQDAAELEQEPSVDLATSEELDSSENEQPAETDENKGLALPKQDDYLNEMLKYYYGSYMKDGDDQYRYSDSYKPYQRKRRSPKAGRRWVSALTADGMSRASAKQTMRVKRDLTADDLEVLLGLDGNDPFREEFDDEPQEFVDDVNDDDLWIRLGKPDEDGYQEFEEETAYPVSDDELARAKERLELLNMIDQNPDILESLRQYYEEPEEEEEGYGIEGYPEETEEFWEEEEEEEEEPELEYRSIVYDGQPGIFIPVKRQYISMVPGVRKRDFYPFSTEPQGHWGAFVDTQEKRNEEAAYERLYRLAQALRADDDLKK